MSSGVPGGVLPAGRSGRALSWLRWASAVSLLGPTLVFGYVAWASYHATIDEARARLSRVAQIGQEHAHRVVETNDVLSRSIDAMLHDVDNAGLRARRAELHTLFRRLSAGLQQLQSLWIWDEAGRPVVSSVMATPPAQLNVADREYFRWALANRGSDWFVSRPLVSRTTGQPFFDFSKRRETPDGAFAGVLSVSLLPGYFSSFFKDLVVQDSAFAMALIRSDGQIIARYPEVGLDRQLAPSSPLLAAMRAASPAGETQGISSIDGRPRYVSYRKVGTLPLYAVATADQDRVLAPWRRSVRTLALFTFPLALGLAGLCAFAARRMRSEQRMAEAHREQVEQRLRAEQALRQAQKLEALGRLTGGVAHDFNNILMVVQSSALLARKLAEHGRDAGAALAAIERAVRSGAQLTRQLLTFARRQPLQLQRLALAEVLPGIVPLVCSTMGSMVQVHTDIDPGLPPVELDLAELELALLNLCLNAKDAMPEGGTLRIRARCVEAPDSPARPAFAGWVELAVSDTGVGIPAELQHKVLEPFFTTKAPGQGTGLGLSQVHGFVTQAGGRIHIDSTPGRGTTVALLLPPGPALASEPAREPVADLRLDGSLLLVEDNVDIASSLVPLLEQLGAAVRHCPSADQALRLLQDGSFTPDVVLSDITMPGAMSGLDLARWLARERPQLPVVLMTGYTDRLHEAVAAGMTVLAKPISPDKLAGVLHDARAARGAVPASEAGRR